MRNIKLKPILLLIHIAALGLITSCDSENKPATNNKMNEKKPIEKVTKTEEEWKAQLTAEQFQVARKAGTERPFGETYEKFKKQGNGAYHCVGCDAKLFSSKHKFDARCGWPAFYDPANAENVKTKVDTTAGMVRTEVICAKCDAHLGHLFSGEGFDTPKDQRFCINGIVLKFVPDKLEKDKK